MSNLEKIKAEIERRKKEEYPCDNSEQNTGYYVALEDILSFIDSLQDEPKPIRKRLVERSQTPEGKALYERVVSEMRAMIDDDLEKAAIIYINTPRVKSDKDKVFNEISRNHEYIAFKAGAKWLAEQRAKIDAANPIRLDEGTLKHIQEVAYESGKTDGMEVQKEQDHDNCQSCEKNCDVVFHKGCQYAIEQMKKEAVEGTVCKQRDSSQATWIELAPNSLPAFDDCEPVKCIILKDDAEGTT